LQPADRIVDLVGEVDEIFGAGEPGSGPVADQVRNLSWTDLRTLQILGGEALRPSTAQKREQHDSKSDALAAAAVPGYVHGDSPSPTVLRRNHPLPHARRGERFTPGP